MNKKILSGNQATSYAVKSCNVDVIAAYPITPQTSVVEYLSSMIEKGQLKSEFVPVESEHSSITVCISAATAGSRTFTATSANGLALMHEQLHWASGSRLPIVMCCVNRGMAAPWTIWNDHQDSISQRDTGWIQLYAEDNQEIYDTIIQAYKLAEKIYIPVMVCYDGFILSHRSMPVQIDDDKKISNFIGKLNPLYNIFKDGPKNVQPVVTPEKVLRDGKNYNGFMEFKHLLHKDMKDAITDITKINNEFYKVFGRKYNNGLFRVYNIEKAEHFIVTMGSLGSECKESINLLKSKNINCGLINIKSYRPFPDKQISKILNKAKTITVFEKNISYGKEGALSSDLKSALYTYSDNKPFIQDIICGIGGREVDYKQIADITEKIILKKFKKDRVYWLNSKPEGLNNE